MAQNGPITIKDSAGSNVVLDPQYKDGLLAVYNDRTTESALSTSLSLGMRKPAINTNDKVSLKLGFPYEVLDGDQSTVETVTVFIDVVVPKTATDAAKENLLAGLNSVGLDDIVADLIKNQGFPY